MIGMSMTYIGDVEFVSDMKERSRREQMRKNVYRPWERDVERRVLRMFQDAGRVDGPLGQSEWKALAPSTVAQKGHSRPLIGGSGVSQFQFGRMSRSTKVRTKFGIGNSGETFSLDNTATSSDGYPYPFVQHFGTSRSDRIPARPNMNFMGVDVIALEARAANWTIDGKQRGAR